MTATSKRPRPPGGLKAPGRRLWSAAVAEFEFNAAEREVLRTTCCLLDELDVIEKALAKCTPLVSGSKGQPVPNGLYDEARKHRDTLARLVAALNLPREAARSSSELGQVAAMARWKRSGTRS